MRLTFTGSAQAYFWALIASAFAGYFAILSSEHLQNKEYLAFIISLIGLIFSWAWFLVNQGSKFWQENWENHVDMLEDEFVGPLYKTILHRPEDRGFVEKHVLGPKGMSVSKINLIVSLFTIFIWLVLLWYVMPGLHLSCPPSISLKYAIPGLGTVIFMVVMYCQGQTHFGPHRHVMFKRDTRIVKR